MYNVLYMGARKGNSADKGTFKNCSISSTVLMYVPARPKKNAVEDFMQVVVNGHVAPLAMTHFAMVSINDEPKHSDLSKVSQCHECQKEVFPAGFDQHAMPTHNVV